MHLRRLCCPLVSRRCFLTLTQALALGYGGNPYGPAGTGKTESVKALGLALGRQVCVQLAAYTGALHPRRSDLLAV